MSATFVLIHGATFGGWCWKKVTPLLRAAGYEVFTPTLTGLGERAHLSTPDVGLDTHIQDVVALLEFEDLTDVVLVGHSYSGMVISGVAQRSTQRLARLVYLDAFLPENGKALFDYLPEPLPNIDGMVKPIDPQTVFGVTDERDLEWIYPRLRWQPVKTLSQPAVLPAPIAVRQAYILTSRITWYVEAAKRANKQGFEYAELLSAEHCPMVTQPAELAKILLNLA